MVGDKNTAGNPAGASPRPTDNELHAERIVRREIVRGLREAVRQIENKPDFVRDTRFAEVVVAGSDIHAEKRTEGLAAGASPRPTDIETQGEKIPHSAGRDLIKERFLAMRKLHPARRFSHNGFTQERDDAAFRAQAAYMADFSDAFDGLVPYEAAEPSYQSMNFAQLRTYFTWRTNARAGRVTPTNAAYAVLYGYELLLGVGADCPQDALDKLLAVYDACRADAPKLEAVFRSWLRDFYLFHAIYEPFEAFAARSPLLAAMFPPAGERDLFAEYAGLADYKIDASEFVTEENRPKIAACFGAMVEAADRYLSRWKRDFRSLVYYETSRAAYVPFSGTPAAGAGVRSDGTLLTVCGWAFDKQNGGWNAAAQPVPRRVGGYLIGTMLKAAEQRFRTAASYPYQLRVGREKLAGGEFKALVPQPEGLFAAMDAALDAAFAKANRLVIAVNPARLEEVRRSALAIQERLLVNPEDAEPTQDARSNAERALPEQAETAELEIAAVTSGREQNLIPDAMEAAEAIVETVRFVAEEPSGAEDEWAAFCRSLDEAERAAVRIALSGGSEAALMKLAREAGRMAEVLVDGVNEKALDRIGDGILELSDGLTVYAEYKENLGRVFI
ncbi:MAG: TerB N-terminal domain-containing protein [Oscillospiraceae bacterium]